VPSTTPPAYMGRRWPLSIPTGTGLDRFLGMGNDTTLGLGLSPGGCITANANLVRDLTSFQPPSQYPSQCITPSSYHHFDPQGSLTSILVMPANPQGQKTAFFGAVNIRRHVALTFSTIFHTLIIQTRRRKWGYIYETNAPWPHAKASETSNSASDSI
jgi:hypothetical protein